MNSSHDDHTVPHSFYNFIIDSVHISKCPAKKTCDDFPNSSVIHQFLGSPIIPFRNENSISVLTDPSKKSSRCWNAFRAADWRHHLISSTRIRYPNNPEERYQNHPIRRTSSEWPVIKWETVIMSPNSSTSELGFYHLVFVMKMICVLECSNIVDGWL